MDFGSLLGDIAGELLSISARASSLPSRLRDVLDVLGRYPGLGLLPRGALLLADGENELVLVAEHDFDATLLAEFQSLSQHQHTGKKATQRRPYPLGPSRSSLHTSVALLHNTVALPLRDGLTLIGVVVIAVDSHARHDDALRLLLFEVAHIVSLVVSRHILETVIDFRDFEVRLVQTDTVRLLGLAEGYRDLDTGLHVLRVAHYSRAIAEAAGLGPEKSELIFQAAPMHDLGKIGIPDAILRNPGQLNEAEFAEMRAHTLIGEKILRGDGDLISAARIIAGSHHERWNGKGYPRGLAGTDIPLYGRICAVADTFDALSTSRPYKAPWSLEDILELIKRESGQHFDPDIVEAFFRALPQIVKFREVYADEILLQSPPTYLTPFHEAEHETYPWREEYKTGIHSIDMHHRYLFELTNKFAESLATGSRMQDIASAYKAFEAYTRIHFREEERLMEGCDYEDIGAHRREHTEFVTTLDANWTKMRRNPLLIGHKTLDFLANWLVNHIMGTDRRAAAAVLAQLPFPDNASLAKHISLGMDISLEDGEIAAA